MITEEELRDRLHAESVQLMPRGDLLKTVAEGHARRHKRARAGLIGGSLAATALVVALLTSLLTGGTPLQIGPASPSDARIIQQAQEAIAAADNMILHILTTERRGNQGAQTHDGWALRSEKKARIHTANVSDRTFNPPVEEEVNYLTQTVTTTRVAHGDVVALITGSGVGDPASWLAGESLTVDRSGPDIQVSGQRYGSMAFHVWLDPKTYLPKRAEFGNYSMAIEWLPATSENLRLFEHTVPPEFTRKEGPTPGGLPIPSK